MLKWIINVGCWEKCVLFISASQKTKEFQTDIICKKCVNCTGTSYLSVLTNTFSCYPAAWLKWLWVSACNQITKLFFILKLGVLWRAPAVSLSKHVRGKVKLISSIYSEEEGLSVSFFYGIDVNFSGSLCLIEPVMPLQSAKYGISFSLWYSFHCS